MKGRGAARAVLLACFAATLARGHGASKGLHLHVRPEPAERGGVVEVEIDASTPLRSLQVGFVGEPALARPVDPPAREARVTLRLPARTEGDTINLQAEARTTDGRELRASAVVRLTDPSPEEAP